MKRSIGQRGSSLMIAILVLAVIVATGVIGYKVMQDSSNQSATSQDSTGPDTLSSAEDVAEAEEALDNTDIDSNVNPGQLNEDLSAVL